MSVDTTIVILDCLDGFRVAVMAAVENITQYKDEATVKLIFSKSFVFPTLADAYISAQKKEEEHILAMGYPSEYGIRIVKWYKPIKRK